MTVTSFVSTQYQYVAECVMAHYWSVFAWDSRRPHLNSPARDDPLRMSDDLYLCTNWNDFAYLKVQTA